MSLREENREIITHCEELEELIASAGGEYGFVKRSEAPRRPDFDFVVFPTRNERPKRKRKKKKGKGKGNSSFSFELEYIRTWLHSWN